MKFSSLLSTVHLLAFSSIALAESQITIDEARNKLGKATVNHGIEVLRAFKKANVTNVMYSPSSMVLGMQPLLFGTGGETKDSLFQFVRYNDLVDIIEDVYDFFETAKIPQTEHCYSSLLLLIDKKYTFVKEFQDFLSLNSDHSDFKAKHVDFKNEKKDVDDLVRNYVKNITNLLIQDKNQEWIGLNRSNRMVVINVAAFDGKFKKKFNKNQTKSGTFYKNGVDKTPVMLMNNLDTYNFAKIGTYSILEIEYEKNGLSFVVILPSQTAGIKRLLKDFNYSFLSKAIKDLKPTKVNVTLPTYETTGQYNINHFLKHPYVGKLIENDAEYPIISDLPGLRLTDILSLSFFKLYEEGTTVASKVKGRSFGGVENFTADHPFMFLIMDIKTKFVHFIGTADDTSVKPRNDVFVDFQ